MSDEPDHISISQANEWLGCQLQFAYHRIEQTPPMDVSGSLVVGSAVHAAIEAHYKAKQASQSLDAKAMLEIFTDYLAAEENEHFVNFKGTRDEEIQMARGLFEVFLEGQTDNKPIAIEEMFRLDIPGLPVPVLGRVDLIEEEAVTGDLIIVDFKTAAAKPSGSNDNYVLGDIEASDQMTLYGIWGRQAYPGRRIRLRMDYLLKTKKPALLRLETSRSQQQEQALQALLCRVWNQLELLRAKVIEPVAQRSFRCNGCGWRHLCPAQRSLKAA